jgi:hypothetical protein
MANLRASIGFVAWLWAMPAYGADYFLETGAVASRDGASEVQRVASDKGYSARVVRRYNPGVGWEYVVRVEGFASADVAVKAAGELGNSTGQALSMFYSDGDEVQAMALPPGATPRDAKPTKPGKPTKGNIKETLSVAPTLSTAEVTATLERAKTAMGGPKAGIAKYDTAENVLFSYRRLVPDGPVVKHSWARRGDDRYLDVQVERGDGTSSRTVILSGKAWLSIRGGAPESQEAARAREVLERFAPDMVLAFPLGFAQAAAERSEFRQLSAAGTQDVGGAPCVLLRYAGDRSSRPVILYVDEKTALVRRVVFGSEAGDLVHEFSDYRTVDGVVLPHRLKSWRSDQLVDEIEILDFDLDPKLSDAWFVTPDVRSP